MQNALRPWATAGVALVGAGAIAVTPIAATSVTSPPSIDIQQHAVDLTAFGATYTAPNYLDLIQNTTNNLEAIANQVLADPAPILSQIVANQLGSAQAIGAGLQTYGNHLSDIITQNWPELLHTAISQMSSGNFQDGLVTLVNIPWVPVFQAGIDLAPPINNALELPVQNLLNVIQDLPNILTNVIVSTRSVTQAPARATGYVIDTLMSSAQTGDLSTFGYTLFNAPAMITDSLLNGFKTTAPNPFCPTCPPIIGFNPVGILTHGGVFQRGLIPVLLDLREQIAGLITPASGSSAAAAGTADVLANFDVSQLVPADVAALASGSGLAGIGTDISASLTSLADGAGLASIVADLSQLLDPGLALSFLPF